jgi:hypothetical protein
MGDNLRGSGSSGGSQCSTDRTQTLFQQSQTTPKEPARFNAFRGIDKLVDVWVV